MKKLLAMVLTSVLAATMLVGCGGEAKTAKVIEIELTQEEYAFGVDKTQPELLESVNTFIAEIKDNGVFDEICNNYFGDGTPVAVKSAKYDASKDQLVVATNAAFEPFEYMQGEDYYGIDMSRMSEFIAFHAAVALLRERGMEQLLHDTYRKCLEQAKLPVNEMVNCVKDIYAPFTDDEITAQITKMLTPEDCTVPVSIVYQSIEGLHEACPNNKGDWYFSGDYPTAGGNRLVNEAYVAYYNQYVK